MARRWSEAEVQYLRENWGRPLTIEELNGHNKRWGTHFTAQDAAKHLGRTLQATWSRANRLGLINKNWVKNKEPIAS